MGGYEGPEDEDCTVHITGISQRKELGPQKIDGELDVKTPG